MKINKARYENAKKQIAKLNKYRKVVDDWEKATKECTYKERVTAVKIAEDGTVTFESK